MKATRFATERGHFIFPSFIDPVRHLLNERTYLSTTRIQRPGQVDDDASSLVGVDGNGVSFHWNRLGSRGIMSRRKHASHCDPLEFRIRILDGTEPTNEGMVVYRSEIGTRGDGFIAYPDWTFILATVHSLRQDHSEPEGQRGRPYLMPFEDNERRGDGEVGLGLEMGVVSTREECKFKLYARLFVRVETDPGLFARCEEAVSRVLGVGSDDVLDGLRWLTVECPRFLERVDLASLAKRLTLSRQSPVERSDVATMTDSFDTLGQEIALVAHDRTESETESEFEWDDQIPDDLYQPVSVDIP